MKFKREQTAEVMPPVGQLIDVGWQHEHIRYFLNQVDIAKLDDMRDKAVKKGLTNLLGKPIACSLIYDGKSSILEVFPAPDEDIEIIVRFYPPMEEV